ncbi:MAG TPA: hypothetical protein VD833_15705 [Vicinamibacterales bacterium]|nr:hypothetical protein [Vicinamibacterales bacterium]
MAPARHIRYQLRTDLTRTAVRLRSAVGAREEEEERKEKKRKKERKKEAEHVEREAQRVNESAAGSHQLDVTGPAD